MRCGARWRMADCRRSVQAGRRVRSQQDRKTDRQTSRRRNDQDHSPYECHILHPWILSANDPRTLDERGWLVDATRSGHADLAVSVAGRLRRAYGVGQPRLSGIQSCTPLLCLCHCLCSATASAPAPASDSARCHSIDIILYIEALGPSFITTMIRRICPTFFISYQHNATGINSISSLSTAAHTCGRVKTILQFSA